MPHGVRERSHPVFPIFERVSAVDLTAQRPHAIMVARVEDPDAPPGVPYSTETAGPGREIGVVGTADRDAAVLLFDDQQRHSIAPLSAHRVNELGTGIVNVLSKNRVKIS